MKKALSILTVGVLSVCLIACSNSKENTTKKDDVTKTSVNETKKEEKKQLTKQEIDDNLKKEAVKVDFIKVNGHEKENKDLKVYAEGKISIVDYKNKMDIFPSFVLTQNEGDGFGMYHITNILGIEGLKDGDQVKLYGTVSGEKNKAGMPIIITTIVEKSN